MSLLPLFSLFSFYCFIALHSVLATNESSALLQIKSALIDPLNQLESWEGNSTSSDKAGSQHCRWAGILCSSEGAVIKLDLSSMNLSGIVSDHIQVLSSLTELNLSNNSFSSELPKGLGNLTSLRSIDLSQNNFVGRFPAGLGAFPGLQKLNASSNNFEGLIPEDLGNASSLEMLDFRGSFFEGSIPKTFKNLVKLRFLGLSGNNLTGEIPAEVGLMSSLETMIIGYNEFSGGIPREFGDLGNLEYLDLAVGTLGGEIPSELGKLKKLTTVYLYQNRFEGKIPPEIGGLESLVYLDLSDNVFSGEIPESLAGLRNLQLLNLMCNNLSGLIPPKIGDLRNLEVLELWRNSLSGSLPLNLGRNSPLQWLDVSSNFLSGEIPPSLCEMGNLTKLILFNNSFSGAIPVGLANCSSLVRVRIQSNRLSGTIPLGLGALPKLQRLEVATNNLSGEIPQDLTLSTSLSFIDFSRNRLDSKLPSSILSIPTLQTFMAASNRLQGEIPDEFQDCPSLSVLDLSHNGFSGVIPQSVASCQKLVNLNFRGNNLSGEIPRAIATMPTLAILDLSNNSLVGRIPQDFGSSPALETLNVSYNKLVGPVPSNGILTTINPDDLAGNAGLCGGAMLPPCSKGLISPIGHHGKAHVRHVLVGFIVGISSIFVAGVLVFVVRQIYRKWYLCSSSLFTDLFRKSSSEWPWRLVAFQRLHFTSADILACIKESNVIGVGGTGVVYRVETQRPHSAIAVKKLWRSEASDVESGDDLFAEVNILGKLRHRNIVRLLGYLHNEADVMMLYEYMPNGSLGAALHGGRVLVDWVSRYNVALGVAQGLAYLHHDCHPPIIHRDVKSNNILLDSDFEARIADFGLARTMLHKNETVSMVAGSYGYIAPEYGYTLKVDEKSDIYSYGVVLLELITGRAPLDPSFGESIDIVEWLRRKATTTSKAKLEAALDPEIAGQCKHVQEEMILVLKIALLCTAKLPKERPSMRDVVTMLGEAKPRRKSICQSWGYTANKEKLIFAHSPVIGLL